MVALAVAALGVLYFVALLAVFVVLGLNVPSVVPSNIVFALVLAAVLLIAVADALKNCHQRIGSLSNTK